jgi:hypothetical protein
MNDHGFSKACPHGNTMLDGIDMTKKIEGKCGWCKYHAFSLYLILTPDDEWMEVCEDCYHDIKQERKHGTLERRAVNKGEPR